MAPQKWQPDMVVGVDVGMTCTAVCYSMGKMWVEPKPIQKWPGKLSLDICNKVHTAVEYDQSTGAVVGWGFKIGLSGSPTRVEEFFKLSLDPFFESDGAVDCDEAHRWFTDYLDCLFDSVETFFAERFPRSQDAAVEYLFSTPTTWNSPAIINKVEASIRRSGFGTRPNSQLNISLTEAEAAAVYAAKQKFNAGDVVIMCDAGGGTTDLNILRVEEASSFKTELKPMVWVEGNSIGSTIIDFKVEHAVSTRLQTVQHLLQQTPAECAKEMMKGRFERFKCSFGSDMYDQPVLRLPIPNLQEKIDVPDAGIEDSQVLITREELKAIFDEQVERIDRLIEDQLMQFRDRQPDEIISYLILSGGLGSSEYVRKQLRRLCELKYNTYQSHAPPVSVLVADEPQLAVALGLVMNRVQELGTGNSIFPYRCARNSYGILTRERYRDVKHMNEEVALDPRDGKKWAEGQIHWLIKRGQLIAVDAGIEHTYKIKLNLGQADQPWSTQFVMSTLPVPELPQSLKHRGAELLCRVESSLTPDLLDRKNHRWWTLKHLKFQIWTPDRRRCSKDHDEIRVQWDDARHVSRPHVANVYPEITVDNRSTVTSMNSSPKGLVSQVWPLGPMVIR